MGASSRRGERITYQSYEPLKEAIEKKLMTSVREHQPHHHQGAHARRGADRQVQRDGAEPARERLLRELRRRRAQVRRQQPLEGLTPARDARRMRSTRSFGRFAPLGRRAQRPLAPAIGPAPRRRSASRSARTSRTSSRRSRSSGRAAIGSSRSRSAASRSTASSTATTRPASARATATRSPARSSARPKGRPGRGRRTRPATGPASTTTRPTSRSKS